MGSRPNPPRVPVTASAPGKLMVAGEYAVLEGTEALVVAVDRRASVKLWLDDSPEAPVPPEARAARAAAESSVGTVPGRLTVHPESLRAGDHKLGLGSSAAVAAATAGAVFAAQGKSLTGQTVRRSLFDAALRGHEAVAPAGSGADVAAAVFGGVLRYRRRGKSIDIAPCALPSDVQMRVVWTGSAARTAPLVALVHQLRTEDPGRYGDAMRPLQDAAQEMIFAADRNDGPGFLSATQAHHRAMRELGQAARAPLVEASLRAICELAVRYGGAAKPSGAGGGDVAIAFFLDGEAADAFESQCAQHPFSPVALAPTGCGVIDDAAPVTC